MLLSDRTWMPVTVLAWHRLEQSFVQSLTGHRVGWLVHLRLGDGGEGRFEFVALSFRQR